MTDDEPSSTIKSQAKTLHEREVTFSTRVWQCCVCFSRALIVPKLVSVNPYGILGFLGIPQIFANRYKTTEHNFDLGIENLTSPALLPVRNRTCGTLWG